MEKQCIEIDGVQVFTADYVFEQMQSQNRRIEIILKTANMNFALSFVAAAVSALALIVLSTIF